MARYSFPGSIPPKFEHKLRRHKQRFGKIAITIVLDKEENLLWWGCNDIGVVIATKWHQYGCGLENKQAKRLFNLFPEKKKRNENKIARLVKNHRDITLVNSRDFFVATNYETTNKERSFTGEW